MKKLVYISSESKERQNIKKVVTFQNNPLYNAIQVHLLKDVFFTIWKDIYVDKNSIMKCLSSKNVNYDNRQ